MSATVSPSTPAAPPFGGPSASTVPLLPMRPGQVERRTHDYSRHGTTDLFAALEVATGRVIARCQRRHRSVDFGRFLDAVDDSVPAALDVHLILDNSAIHKTALIHRWLAQRPRYHVHFTPMGSSWFNLVERWFGLLTEKQLRRGVHRSTRELEEAVTRYVESTNAHAKPFVWTKTADDIQASVSSFYELITQDTRFRPLSPGLRPVPRCQVFDPVWQGVAAAGSIVPDTWRRKQSDGGPWQGEAGRRCPGRDPGGCPKLG